ncbi:Hypothetical protein CAP_4618 [Chondromyces apiculatus DSM 436]|uniref:DUF99 family protein n=2 Tax=Chondromyces apiculatus TaxID=51 RepID=A0A017T541_9BACT|nr:Hypothetical protein CAP_4618 [Chondromyces apiculatus DSM 436]
MEAPPAAAGAGVSGVAGAAAGGEPPAPPAAGWAGGDAAGGVCARAGEVSKSARATGIDRWDHMLEVQHAGAGSEKPAPRVLWGQDMGAGLSHVIGVDDAPFLREHRGDVAIVGAVFAGSRLEGVLSARVRRDGRNATTAIAAMIARSRFATHAQAVMLQGIALAGFNVVDLHGLHAALGLPVVVVARRAPNLDAIREALLTRVRGGRRKWALIEQAGPMEPLAGVFVQRAGVSLPDAEALLRRFALSGKLPEPLRVAHLIAGGVTRGESRGRA